LTEDILNQEMPSEYPKIKKLKVYGQQTVTYVELEWFNSIDDADFGNWKVILILYYTFLLTLYKKLILIICYDYIIMSYSM
jgi:hypothetical protein